MNKIINIPVIKHNLGRDVESIDIIPLFDVHIGAEKWNKKLFEKVIKKIKNENIYYIIGGDLMDMAIKESIGDVYSTDRPQEQLEYAFNIFEPVKDRCLGVISGNHEDRLKNDDINPLWVLSRAYNWNYMEYEGIVKIQFGKQGNDRYNTWVIFVSHGYGSGRTVGSKVNASEKAEHIINNADIYLTGHSHINNYYLTSSIYFNSNKNRVIQKIQHNFICGGFLEREKYAAKKMLKPTVTGVWQIKLLSDKIEFKIIN